ncbi:MAG: outer membrane protein assembly factor BamD [Ferruginibacter sp.]|nr:outer membrane protein assembly factor BamD [Ferruginibacter sp.]
MRFSNLFLVFLVAGGMLISCDASNKVLNSKDPEFKLTKADEYYAKKKYRIAAQLYEQLFASYKGSQKFEDLYYKYAYCYYYMESYQDAENLFKGFLEVFPTSSRAEEVDYMRAYSYYKQSPRLELDQSATQRAMAMMQTFINTHPGSERNKEAARIIDESRKKLEDKEKRGAQLRYDLGQFRAAAIAYENLMNNFPETTSGDAYKLMVVKSYFKFANLSIESRKQERFEKVITEVDDFTDRFPESKWLKEVESYKNLSLNQIKALKNEQTKTSAKL